MPVVASTVASVHEAAQTLLETSALLLEPTVGGPVALTYLSPGLPAFDYACDQVIVWNSGIAEEFTSPLTPFPQIGQRPRLGWVNLVTLSVFAGRCIHVGQEARGQYSPPGAELLTADSVKVMEDGWALWVGLHYAIRNEALFGGTCQDVQFRSMTPITPQGALAGWIVVVSFELGGYQ